MRVHRIGPKVFQRLSDELERIPGDKIDALNKVRTILLHCCYGSKKFRLLEGMYLIGKQLCSFMPNQLKEHKLGYFEAIAPGVVLFIPDNLSISYELMGMLERAQNYDRSLFVLRPFIPGGKYNANSLEIFPSSRIQGGGWEHHHDTCPVFVRWQIWGSDNDNLMGITNLRWQEMSAWLDRWLPKEFAKIPRATSNAHLERVRLNSETKIIPRPITNP